MENTNFQKIEISEIDEVARLDKLCIGDTKDYMIYNTIYRNETEAWVLRYGKKLVGYILFGHSPEWKQSNYMFIYRTSVHPKYRRRGYGRYMREHVLKVAIDRGHTLICSGIKADNTAMLNLTKSMGFVEYDTECESYLKNNILLMCRELE